MEVVTIIDISIAIILAGAVIFGYMTGLIMQIAHLASLAAAYMAAATVAKLFPLQIGSQVIFSVVFFVVSVILRLVVRILKVTDYIPVLGFISHIGGAVTGFLVNFIIIYIICSIFFGIIPQEILDSWGLTENAIKDSILLQVFY
ncbi:MAG TPA: hypothetical protein DCZ23_03190 [Lachnospiraceae bacterium]|nr:hypothetical protein [Lachnospiraceae bacterium]